MRLIEWLEVTGPQGVRVQLASIGSALVALYSWAGRHSLGDLADAGATLRVRGTATGSDTGSGVSDHFDGV